MGVRYAKKIEWARNYFLGAATWLVLGVPKNVSFRSFKPLPIALMSGANGRSASHGPKLSMNSVGGHRVVTTALRKEIRLLVVDDHVEHFEQLQEMAGLYHPEYQVECKLASSAGEAVHLAASWGASVVLLDLHVVSRSEEHTSELQSH